MVTIAADDLPKALDHSHHLSELARNRYNSPLKDKYWGKPGVISLGGGLPHPDYFPVASLSGQIYPPDAFGVVPPPTDSTTAIKFNDGAPGIALSEFQIPKDGAPVNLANALQYSTPRGIGPLHQFTRDFTQRVFKPAYADWVTLIHAGNTDGWAVVVDTLLDQGQGYFVEEFSYPSAQATAAPHELIPITVAMDAQGLRADDLRKQCAEWDPVLRGGMPRPHVLYTVPIGQNPCGTCMGGERKKAIYDVCVEFDIIIVEDDPYYFLQQEPYVAKTRRGTSATSVASRTDTEFIAILQPTFLHYDFQGRVIRLDSFSKTLAPGSRLGWYTCSPIFAERIERQTETSTQNPSGFSQAIICQLLSKEWGIDGYLRWLRGMRAQYTMRRNFTVDNFVDQFEITEREEVGRSVFVCSSGGKSLFEFVPPGAGMFLWMKLHLQNHPAASGSPTEDQLDELERGVWTELAESGLLVSPGRIFNAAEHKGKGKGHFRISFSFSEAEVIRKAISIYASVIKRVFAVA